MKSAHGSEVVCPSPKTAIEAARIPFGALFENEVSKIAAKSFVLKNLTCKFFRIKDRGEIFLLTP